VQKIYVTKLIDFIRLNRSGDMGMLDGCTVAADHISNLYKEINGALPGYADKPSKSHLEDLRIRLKAALDYQKKYVGEGPKTISGSSPNSLNSEKIKMIANEPFPFYQDKKKMGCFEEEDWIGKNRKNKQIYT